jgi:hypothetical protein
LLTFASWASVVAIALLSAACACLEPSSLSALANALATSAASVGLPLIAVIVMKPVVTSALADTPETASPAVCAGFSFVAAIS